MNKDQFEPLAQSLYEKGYKKYNQQWHDDTTIKEIEEIVESFYK